MNELLEGVCVKVLPNEHLPEAVHWFHGGRTGVLTGKTSGPYREVRLDEPVRVRGFEDVECVSYHEQALEVVG